MTTGSFRQVIGPAIDWITRQWVKATGRRFEVGDEAWLDGPVGGRHIGDEWLASHAESVRGRLASRESGGLIERMAVLDQPGFGSALLAPAVLDFYQATSEWRLELWSRWSPWARQLGWALAAVFARRLQQLNLPIDPLETSRGMTSRITAIVAPDGSHLGTAWQRTLRSNGQTVFGGLYGVVTMPGSRRPVIRVVFPLPGGSITVFLRPENGEGGRLRLVSDGSRWGDPGAYLIVRGRGTALWARRVPLPERFEVFVDEEGVLRADHVLHFMRWPVIQMHYRMERKGRG